jgi:hypothetical protein
MNSASLDWVMIAVIAACVLIVIAVVFAGYLWLRRWRARRSLRTRFGPEYDRLLSETGSRKAAEARLRERERRVAGYDIRPLREADRLRYQKLWHNLQAEFVENPKEAVSKADAILTDLMADRGYPMGEFDRRAADLSVDHPVVVQNYRTAHEIALRHRDGKASTEDLRQAVIHYKALFSELLDEGGEGAPMRAAAE